MWIQKNISLEAKSRGFHVVTQEIEQAIPEIRTLQVGVVHLLLQHTSASLSLNENADPTVLHDMEKFFNLSVPERAPYFKHTYEGDDDMPAHIKSSLIGVSISLPISNGRLSLGTWQGIYLGEHRNFANRRQIVATINGE